MECLLAIVQIVGNSIPDLVVRGWIYHKRIYENLDTLKEKLEELNCRKRDIESRLNVELVVGETKLRDEVDHWLRKVGESNVEINDIEGMVRRVKFFSRAGLGKKVFEKIAEIEEIHKNGEFQDGLVIPIPKRGDVLPTTTALGGETTFKEKLEEIWASLMDDKVTKIGVYGMGGIGKTTALEHINNRILERKDKFDNAIWVTVSSSPDGVVDSVLSLQDKIARKMDIQDKIKRDDDNTTRAAMIFAEMNRRKRFVLILDDLWEAEFLLKDIGIPEPTPQNGCKLVVTTRSVDVCRRLGCKNIEMKLLSNNEALNLFLDIAGLNIQSFPKLERTVKDIVQECAGLPLAIVTIAASLKGTTDYYEWVVALEELRKAIVGSISSRLYARLKFSYDRLNDKRLKDCLLYCALYPEDYEIERDDLIEDLIVEGIIEEGVTRQYGIQKGQVMLNRLVNACLLNDDPNVKCVKMHDLVRDMAIQITSESPRFMIKAKTGLKLIPSDEHWKDDLERVSLMQNYITKINPSTEPPKCPRLTTLLLSENRDLRSITTDFFVHMKRLNLLDLSYTAIETLPDSVSDLVNLTGLFLRRCVRLKHVPSLAKLTGLRTLDCGGSGIKELPQGLEMLSKLRCLNLNGAYFEIIPFARLSNLQFLSLRYGTGDCPKVRPEELENLKNLETFEGVLYDIHSFNAFVESLEQRRLTSFIIQLGTCNYEAFSPVSGEKSVCLAYFEERNGGEEAGGHYFQLSLPREFDFLCIMELDARNWSEFISFKNVIRVSRCEISGDFMEHAFSYSPSIDPFLESVESLSLLNLLALRALFKMETDAPLSLPPTTFSSLKFIEIEFCEKIEKLFTGVASIPNLEHLSLQYCEELMEITPTNIATLPKLTKLELIRLPKLESIPFVANSLQHIFIAECWELKKIHVLDTETPLESLKRVLIDQSSWESIQWDHPNAKDVIGSLNTQLW